MSSSGPRFVRLRALLARGLAGLTLGEKAVLAIGVPMYIAVHRAYAVRFFGEDDAANLATDAIFWHFSGSPSLELTDYRLRTSPLYVHALERTMHLGVPVAAIPWVMTLASIVASTIVLVAGYFLLLPLAGRAAAAVATGLLMLTPGMWLGATYGMAHIPALAAWMASLLVFSLLLEDDARTVAFWGRFAAAVACAFVALGFKADLILTGFAFPGLAFVNRKGLLRTLVLAPAVPLAGLALQLGYGRLLARGAGATSFPHHIADPPMTYAAYWHQRFPFDLDALTTHRTTDATLSCAGPFLTALALFALVCLFFMPERARSGAWLSSWALPPILFWAVIDGNSARHNIGAMPPLMFALAAVLVRIAETPVRVASLAAGVALLNYFSDTHGSTVNLGTMEPRTNVLELSEQLFLRSEAIWRRASPFAGLQNEKKLAIDRHWLAWTIFAEAANDERRGKVTTEGGRGFRVERRGAPPQIVRFIYADDPLQARRIAQYYRNQGYVVWSASFPL